MIVLLQIVLKATCPARKIQQHSFDNCADIRVRKNQSNTNGILALHHSVFITYLCDSIFHECILLYTMMTSYFYLKNCPRLCWQKYSSKTYILFLTYVFLKLIFFSFDAKSHFCLLCVNFSTI